MIPDKKITDNKSWIPNLQFKKEILEMPRTASSVDSIRASLSDAWLKSPPNLQTNPQQAMSVSFLLKTPTIQDAYNRKV